jgi:hypothetical protein
MIKVAIKKVMPRAILNWHLKRANVKMFNRWVKTGFPIPTPHLYKQQLIREYQNVYKYSTLVETGTYLGDMVEAQRRRFNRIISIELSSQLFFAAQRRFRRHKHITIYHGDSGQVLPVIISQINEPAIFWLDGHYSKGITARGDKDCPIFDELKAILSHGDFNHVLLIDDARCFTGTGDYPTIEQVSDFILQRNNKYNISIRHDIIQVEIPK